GNAAMGTQTDMQIRLADGGAGPRICCEGGGPHADGTYPDSFGFVPGYTGPQRVVASVYRKSGYAPVTAAHEMQLWCGATVFGNDNKRAIEILLTLSGYMTIVWHDGPSNGYHVISSSELAAFAFDDGDTATFELNRTAKTLKAWHNSTLCCSTQWATTHDEIDSTAQAILNNLGSGGGLGGLRRSGDAVEGNWGFRNFRISSVLQDAG
ncbi:MAG TPA: hypothetical protein PL196_11435, partial [Burkholderiaceae bacterium]|nr:hypothetical protein [Burkholderiaceae bacterium]